MDSKIVASIIVGAVLLISGMMIGSTSVTNSWRLDAAQSSCAQFNPEHGQFEWIEVK